MDTFFQIIGYTIPALVVFITTYYVLKSTLSTYMKNEQKLGLIGIKNAEKNTTLPLKLQAYERLSLFLERITPNSLIYRVRKPNMTVRDLHIALLSNIRQEFEHNLSQQIYVSTDCWETIKRAKEETINIINHTAKDLSPKEDALDLSKAIIEYTGKENPASLPSQLALNFLKNEVRKILA